MQLVTLAKSELEVSRIGFGCWAIGGTDWGPVEDGESIKAIRRALDRGINFFDTADVYGDGHSEEVLGKALGRERKRVVVATKAGGVKKKGEQSRYDTSRKHIMEAMDLSLRRLKTDYVDLYQIHVFDASTPVSETMSALMELVQQGKARHVGVSNMNVSQLSEYMKYGPITTIQPGYSMIERQPEKELLPFCHANNISVLAYSPLGRSLLTGKYAKGSVFSPDDVRAMDPEFQGKIFEINLSAVEKLRPLAAESHRTLAQLAVAWVLSNPAVAVALVGAKTRTQVEENAGASDTLLPPDVLARMSDILEDTEAEKTSYREGTISFLRANPITKIESEESGREMVDAIILWLMVLHGEFLVATEVLYPLFSTALLLKSKGTVGQEQALEEIRQKLAGIHSGLEKQGGGKR
jgi:aryl-alcohol dehydrogenase-like predicted oxidoreductase